VVPRPLHLLHQSLFIYLSLSHHHLLSFYLVLSILLNFVLFYNKSFDMHSVYFILDSTLIGSSAPSYRAHCAERFWNLSQDSYVGSQVC
jgi:hypothetical protein